MSSYQAVNVATIFLQLPRFILILIALKYRAVRRFIYGSETILLTLELVLPKQEDQSRCS